MKSNKNFKAYVLKQINRFMGRKTISNKEFLNYYNDPNSNSRAHSFIEVWWIIYREEHKKLPKASIKPSFSSLDEYIKWASKPGMEELKKPYQNYSQKQKQKSIEMAMKLQFIREMKDVGLAETSRRMNISKSALKAFQKGEYNKISAKRILNYNISGK